jgi:hypothetical protein
MSILPSAQGQEIINAVYSWARALFARRFHQGIEWWENRQSLLKL